MKALISLVELDRDADDLAALATASTRMSEGLDLPVLRQARQLLAESKVPREAIENSDAAMDSVVADIFRKFPSTPTT